MWELGWSVGSGLCWGSELGWDLDLGCDLGWGLRWAKESAELGDSALHSARE